MKKFIILVAFILFCSVSTVVKPEFLANNVFLVEFVNQELLALLAVILAITFASVANIHLALNRIVLQKQLAHLKLAEKGHAHIELVVQ